MLFFSLKTNMNFIEVSAFQKKNPFVYMSCLTQMKVMSLQPLELLFCF